MATTTNSTVWIDTMIRPRLEVLARSSRALGGRTRREMQRAWLITASVGTHARRHASAQSRQAFTWCAVSAASAGRSTVKLHERTTRQLPGLLARAPEGALRLLARARSQAFRQPQLCLALLTGGVWLAHALSVAELTEAQRVVYAAALVLTIGFLYLADRRREAESSRLLSDLHEARGSLSSLHGRLDTKVLTEMARLSDNIEELDDRSLVRLRLSATSLVLRVREELELRSALDPFREAPEHTVE